MAAGIFISCLRFQTSLEMYIQLMKSHASETFVAYKGYFKVPEGL